MNEAVKMPDDEAVAPDQPVTGDKPVSEAAGENTELVADAEPGDTAPIESRFLYVDVAAQRAKQLRRGALPRLDGVPARDLENPQAAANRLKLERVAMREVDAGKIVYEVPTDDDPAKTDGP